MSIVARAAGLFSGLAHTCERQWRRRVRLAHEPATPASAMLSQPGWRVRRGLRGSLGTALVR